MEDKQKGYIYLIIEREFIKTDENIYKIGKTSQKDFKRFNQYPNGSCLLYFQEVDEYNKVEKYIIEELKNKHKLIKDIGREYFQGDLINILLDIIKVTRNYVTPVMVCQSKKELDNYYIKEKDKLVSHNELMKAMMSRMPSEEYEVLLSKGNRHYLASHKALNDIILKSLLEEYIDYEYIINTKRLHGRVDGEKCLILSKYNAYKYIIECIRKDPGRGDYFDESNRKHMKLAGEFLYKYGGNELMSSFLHNIPKIFHRDIDYIWNDIGDWKC
jgi:hypothetical protein